MLIKKFEILDIRQIPEKVSSFIEKNGFGPYSRILLPHKEKYRTYIAFLATAAIISSMTNSGIPVFRHPLKQDQYIVPEDSISNLTLQDLLGQNGFMYISIVSFLTGTTAGLTWTYDNSWNDDNNSVECIGGGASGAAVQLTSTTCMTGGGGGAYTRQVNIALSANAGYRCGAGGTGVAAGAVSVPGTVNGNDGADTWFNDTAYPTTGSNKVGAKGGLKGTFVNPAATVNGGAGGAAASAYPASPTAAFSGGRGGNVISSLHDRSPTGGGGAAGYSAAGSNGADTTAATTATAGGAAGTDTGGTSGAANSSGSGGAGGDGTYWASSPTKYGSGGGGGGGLIGSNATNTGGSGGLYGAGGGACCNRGGGNNSNVLGTSGSGRQGIIVLTWTRKRVIISG